MGYMKNEGCYSDESKENYKDSYKDNCKDNDKNFCHSEKHPKPQKILLECGCNPQDAIFEIDDERVEEHQEFVLDTVTVDTTCLFKPLVKIEFSSIIFFEAEAKNCGGGGHKLEAKTINGGDRELEVNLLFELVRICKGEKECVQSWKYTKEFEVENEFEVKISEPFTVTFCDRACPGCCEYKMIVKGKDFEGEFDALRVVKPNLSALAQGSCES